jgi:hypothetical protein
VTLTEVRSAATASDPEAVAQGRTCIFHEAGLVRRQHPERRDENSLGLLLAHRSSAPALPHRPLAHAPLQPDHVPYAASRRAADATQRGHRSVHLTACVKLPLVQFRLAPRARHAQDRQRPERVELRDDERRLEVLGGIVHRLIDGAGPEHLAERVDGPVVIDDSAVRILLSHLLEFAAAHLVRLDPAPHRLLPGRRPYSRLASLISACRVQSSRTSSGRSTATPCVRHAARRIASRSSSLGAVSACVRARHERYPAGPIIG